MKFTEHRDSNINTVKNYRMNDVKVNNMTFTSSFYMTQTAHQDEWKCINIADLNTEMLDDILKLNPEVIILGTGEEQVFPDLSVFAYCANQGVGLEVMANDAACRTYNVLTTEDRDIVLALIMHPQATQ